MSDELTLDVAVERIGELVRDVDKLNSNWKNELSRRVDAETQRDAATAQLAAAREEADDLKQKVLIAIARLTPTAEELNDMECAGTPNLYLEQWLRECLQATRTRADNTDAQLEAARAALVDAERAQMERDCAVVCYQCAEPMKGLLPAALWDGAWRHPIKDDDVSLPCRANHIRCAFAALHPEPPHA